VSVLKRPVSARITIGLGSRKKQTRPGAANAGIPAMRKQIVGLFILTGLAVKILLEVNPVGVDTSKDYAKLTNEILWSFPSSADLAHTNSHGHP
jgi:hypothetical protein